MDYVLTQRWNETSRRRTLCTTSVILRWGFPELWPGYRSALNGRIHLVLGNHDRDDVFMRDSVGFVGEEFNVIVEVEGVAL
jgi:hypothetical protein